MKEYLYDNLVSIGQLKIKDVEKFQNLVMSLSEKRKNHSEIVQEKEKSA